MIVSDDIEKVSKASDMKKILEALHLTHDVERLLSRKARSGKSALRGRGTKTGRSLLFVITNSPR